MPSKNTKFYSLILIGLDFVVLMAVFFIAYYVRTQIDHRDLLHTVYASDYLLGFVVIAPVWIILYASLGLYSASVYSRRLVEWGRLLLGTFMGILLVIGWEYGTRMYIFPARLVAMYVFLGSFLAIGTVRELFRLTRSWLFQYNHGVNRVMVIGTSLATRDIAESISTTYKSGFRVVAMAGPKRFVHLGSMLFILHHSTLPLRRSRSSRSTPSSKPTSTKTKKRTKKCLVLPKFNHWVAKKNIDGVFASIKFWLARDEVVLDMVDLCGTKHFLILFLVFVEVGLDNGVDLELLDLRKGRVE